MAIAGRGIVFFLILLFPILSVFVVLAGVLGITTSFPMPLLNAILSNNSSEREQGEILGINASYLSISNALGPVVAGLLVSISYSTPVLGFGYSYAGDGCLGAAAQVDRRLSLQIYLTMKELLDKRTMLELIKEFEQETREMCEMLTAIALKY